VQQLRFPNRRPLKSPGPVSKTPVLPNLDAISQGCSCAGEHKANLITSIINHIICQCMIDTQHYSPSMSCLTPFTSFFQSTKRISQVAVCRGSQQQRYVSFSTYACQRVNKHGPRATVHIRHRSTFLTMTHFSMSFFSIGHFF
jgi:hypothetical protein